MTHEKLAIKIYEATTSRATELDLSNSQLASLPLELFQFASLTVLNLTGNTLTTLPPEIGQLTSLIDLYLDKNQLTTLPPEIGQLRNLQQLILWDNKLTALPPEIGQLTNLTMLALGGNQLTTLPPEIGQLTSLTLLDLRSNQLTTLPPEIGQLRNLQRLAIWENKLTALPPEIGQLASLMQLNLGSNQLATLPPEIDQFTSLTMLDLHSNQLTALPPEIGQLTSLTALYLPSNQLTALPPEIGQLTKLEKLDLAGNPLSSLPPEICSQGTEAIRQYCDGLCKGKHPLNEVKILLIGDGAAGKTSLVKQLLGQPFDQHENTTHGINIQGWEQEVGGRKIRINIWDFGGQEIQHATHQFFLSKRSLYVLVLDGRKDERPEYWLRHVEAFGGDSPVLVVLNKIDSNPSFDVNRPFLLEKYPGIRDFFRVSCKSGKGLAQFKEALLDGLNKVEMLETIWPASWFAVKRRLEQMDRPYISAEKYKGICNEAEIADEQSRETLVDFLHDLGVAVHFRDFILDAMHVLNPLWVTNAVYKIITAEKMADSKGFLHLKHLGEILPQCDREKLCYPPETHPYLMGLMKKFELCYPVGEEAVLIPQLLPVSEPLFAFDCNGSLRFALHYPDFMPPSVFPRFMVKVHKDIKAKTCWRTGVVLKDAISGAQAVVKVDHEARRINILVQGERSREYLHYLRYLFIDINSSFEKLAVRERVPMPDEPYITADYETLLKYAGRGIDVYFPAGSGKEYSVRALLGLVQLKDRDELGGLAEKIGLEPDEKESFLDMAASNFDTKLVPPFISINLTELFKQIRAWDKQRQQQPRK
jgi:hypothetical protein